MTRIVFAALISAVVLAAGGTARAADYGYSATLTIASVQAPTSIGSVSVQGTYAVTHTCDDAGSFTYCGYFLDVTTVPQGAPCRPDTLAWVQTGIYDHIQGQVPQSGQVSWSEYATANAQPKTACLYTGSDDRLIATAAYTLPGTAAPASTTPTSTSAATVPPMTIADARANLTGVLRKKFGGRFGSHKNFKKDCYRLTTQKVRCRVRWDHGQWRYAGAIDMRNDPDHPATRLLFTSTVHRTRLHRGSGSAPSSPTPSRPTPKPSASCDPSYKGACLKPNVSDYDCAGGSGDGPYYVQGPITVVGDDHYGLDRDGDGIACES
jgi:hypothetical protein